jgi:hypothetical protein
MAGGSSDGRVEGRRSVDAVIPTAMPRRDRMHHLADPGHLGPWISAFSTIGNIPGTR